ncbi:Myosin light polypeptide 6 [Myotis davidii]|uniref:Myosin light polypeptide 6 n=1 Tax=Myotis davidii TaxID=225400 RepID=L5MGN5_MYODS|nr:Myosin light polypeptide 6 [Myotis davidii]
MFDLTEDKTAEFKEAFQLFESTGAGKILHSQCGAVVRAGDMLLSLWVRTIEEEVEMLVAGHKDSNGCISYEELVRMVLNS